MGRKVDEPSWISASLEKNSFVFFKINVIFLKEINELMKFDLNIITYDQVQVWEYDVDYLQ
jgi:hypothetical protein